MALVVMSTEQLARTLALYRKQGKDEEWIAEWLRGAAMFAGLAELQIPAPVEVLTSPGDWTFTRKQSKGRTGGEYLLEVWDAGVGEGRG